MSEMFDFKFYKWEKEFKDKPFLRQPFGDKWKSIPGERLDKWQESLLQD